MELIKLTTKEQLISLKKNDVVVVQWNERANEFKTDGAIVPYRIWGVNHIDEIILNSKKNTYFSIDLYLEGKSTCKEICIVKG